MKAAEKNEWAWIAGMWGLLIGLLLFDGCGALVGTPPEPGPVICRYGVFVGQDSAASVALVRLTDVPPPPQITTQAVPRFPGVLLCSELEAPPRGGP